MTARSPLPRRGAIRRSGLAVALAATLLLGACDGAEKTRTNPDRSEPPPDFVGIVTEDVFGAGREYRRRNLSRQADIGVRLVRQTFDWSQIETAPGRYDLSHHDDFVAALAEHGIRVLPILFNPPSFRSGAPSRGRRRGTYPPERYEDLGKFGAALARRYGPGGTLWSEREELRELPIRSWQVWNEPNIPAYWPAGPDAAQYAELLRQTARQIRAVDPKAEIVTAGLPESRLGIPLEEFVGDLYRAQAKPAFDTLAIHPYARDERGVLAAVEAARRVVAAQGDDAPIWVTEFGWASGGPESEFTVGEKGQARRIRGAFQRLAAERQRLGIRGLVYFNWRDGRPYPGGRDFFGLHTGLLDLEGQPKPALDAFRNVLRQLASRGGAPIGSSAG